jgi:hypothetical protein
MSDLGNGGGVHDGSVGSDDSLGHQRFPVDDSVESVDGVGGVFDGTSGTIRIDEGVASLDDISAAALDLALGVSSQTVLDVVSVLVLGMRVVLVGDHGLSDGDGSGGVGGHRGADQTGVGGGDEGGEDYKLEKIVRQVRSGESRTLKAMAVECGEVNDFWRPTRPFIPSGELHNGCAFVRSVLTMGTSFMVSLAVYDLVLKVVHLTCI